jgi:hypothetical protein
MSASREEYRNWGHMCCGFWDHRRTSAVKLKIGLLMIVIGLIWMGVRVGLFDFSWLRTVYFWPMMIVLIGAFMVYKGLKRKYVINKQKSSIKQ